MARPTTLRGSKFLIKLGDGGTPEVFSAPCALDTKGLSFSTSTNEFSVADCDDPDAPIWVDRVKQGLSAEISGSGTLAKESLALYQAFFEEVDPRNVQIVIDYDVGPVTYQGMFLMTAFSFSAPSDGLIQVDITMQSSGEVAQI